MKRSACGQPTSAAKRSTSLQQHRLLILVSGVILDNKLAVLRASLGLQSIDFWVPLTASRGQVPESSGDPSEEILDERFTVDAQDFVVLQFLKNKHPDLYGRLCELSNII